MRNRKPADQSYAEDDYGYEDYGDGYDSSVMMNTGGMGVSSDANKGNVMLGELNDDKLRLSCAKLRKSWSYLRLDWALLFIPFVSDLIWKRAL